jgi:electron transfer flavoprotein-quinone oxidoreductase
MPKKLYRDGLVLVGDAAGMCLNTGTILRGIDLAIVSGVAAARAILANEGASDVGAAYMQQLETLMLLPTMRLYAKWHELLANPRMVSAYPNMVNAIMKMMFTVDGKLPERLDKAIFRIVKNHVTLGQLIADGWKGFRTV